MATNVQPPGSNGARRILLVDDNPGDSRLVIELTRIADPDAYDFTEARSLAEARAALDDGPFAAVLVDLGLPDGVGVDNIRILSEATEAPLVVLTGSEDRRLMDEAEAAGAVAFLSKMDLDEEVLRDVLARVTG